MKEAYRLFLDLKQIHPLTFWTCLLLMLFLMSLPIGLFLRRKKNNEDKQTTLQEKNTSIFRNNDSIKRKVPETTTPKLRGQLTTNQIGRYLPEKNNTTQRDIEEKEIKNENKLLVGEKISVTPKPQKELPEAKTEIAVQKNELIFVNYAISKPETQNAYPILRYPRNGTVVRSYRLGNTKRRGYKEESFEKSILKYFGEHFIVLGNARLNTGKETRPFEPDIAIVSESNTTNIRIDIEIDEPYAGITRQPTHCKGEDNFRDTYFVDRGWVVIRFSEYQVHTQEIDCLRFIAEVVKSAIPKFEIHHQLTTQASLLHENTWDIIKAQKWEKDRYREKYLNHIFQIIQERTETRERDFNAQELEEERLVNHTPLGQIQHKEAYSFNLKNIHPRDERVAFYSEPHIYTIDNTPAPSISTLVSKFFPEFDSYGVASNLSPSNPLFGLPIERIVEIWDSKGKQAAKQGTYLHEQIERFYLGQQYDRSNEFHLFEQFYNDHQNFEPYRTEWRIFDESHRIAGTIDLIIKKNTGYELYDWKRSKKIINTLTGGPITIDTWGKRGVGQLSTIHDTSYNRYCLQQSLYKYILEKNYGLTISKMYLVILYPDYSKYFKVEVPYHEEQAYYILKTL